MLAEFKKFLLQTNALALAVGVIIGGAIGKVVSSLVSDVLMPIISLGIPGGEWRDAKIALATDATGKVTKAIAAGQFFGNIIDFIIIATCVFALTKLFIKPEPPASPMKACPECTEKVPVEAKRCKYCTSAV